VGIGGAFRRRLCRALLSVGIEAGLLHLLFRPALQFLNGAGDRPEFVGLAMEKDDILLRLIAAEPILGEVSASTSSGSV
jgi:hypothetical protein